MKTSILIITVIIAFNSSLSAQFGSKTEADKIIAIYNKQIKSYESQKAQLEKKRDKGQIDYQSAIAAIAKTDSLINALSTKRDNFIANLKPEDLKEKTKVQADGENNGNNTSLAKKQKKEIGGTGWLSEKRMYNTLNVNRQVMLDEYRQEALKQRVNGCGTGTAGTKNGILYYTASSHRGWYGNYNSYPAAEFVITAIDANGNKLAGIPEKRATLYLQDEPTIYSLLDGRYHGEVWINGQKVWQKDFDVIIGEKSANYRGADYEFKLGCDVSRF